MTDADPALRSTRRERNRVRSTHLVRGTQASANRQPLESCFAHCSNPGAEPFALLTPQAPVADVFRQIGEFTDQALDAGERPVTTILHLSGLIRRKLA